MTAYEYPDLCAIPSECGPRRACQLEQWGLKKGKDFGRQSPPPCLAALLRSIEELEVATRWIDTHGQEVRPDGPELPQKAQTAPEHGPPGAPHQ